MLRAFFSPCGCCTTKMLSCVYPALAHSIDLLAPRPGRISSGWLVSLLQSNNLFSGMNCHGSTSALKVQVSANFVLCRVCQTLSHWCDHLFPSLSSLLLPNRKHHQAILNPSSTTCPCFSQKIEEPAPSCTLLSKLSEVSQAEGVPCQSDSLSRPSHRSAPKKQEVGNRNWEPCRFCTLTNQPGSVGCTSRPVHPLETHVSAHSCFIFCFLHQKLSGQEAFPQPSLMMMRTQW